MPPLNPDKLYGSVESDKTDFEVWEKAARLFPRMLAALTKQRGNGMTMFFVLSSKSAFYQTPDQQGPTMTRAWLECHPEIETKIHCFTQTGRLDANRGIFIADTESEVDHLAIAQESFVVESANHSSRAQSELLDDLAETLDLIEAAPVEFTNEEEIEESRDYDFHSSYPRYGDFGMS